MKLHCRRIGLYVALIGLITGIKLPIRSILEGDICGYFEGRKLYLAPGSTALIFARNVTLKDSETPERTKLKHISPVFHRLRFRRSPEANNIFLLKIQNSSHPNILKLSPEISHQKSKPSVTDYVSLNESFSTRLLNNTNKVNPDQHQLSVSTFNQSQESSNQSFVYSANQPLEAKEILTSTSLPTLNTLNIYVSQSPKMINSSIESWSDDFKPKSPDSIKDDKKYASEDSNIKEFETETEPTPNSEARCGLELFTCPDCHFKYTVEKIELTTCSHDQSCRCDYVKIREPPYLAIGGRDICSVGDVTAPYSTKIKDVTIDFFHSRNYNEAFTISITAEKNIYHISGEPGITSGSIQSPFFPELYPNTFGAIYIFKASDYETKIKITFLDFQISPWSFVEIEDTNKSRTAIFNGSTFRPPVLVSSGREMSFRFDSNGETARGFTMQYDFIHKNSVEVLPVITDCGGYVTNLGGMITMMNMTGNISVPNNVSVTFDCIWIIQPLQEYVFKSHTSVRVVQFEKMGAGSEIEVRQGTTSKDYLLEKLTVDETFVLTPKEHVVAVDTGFYIRLKAIFNADTKMAIIYTSFSYHGSCYASTNFLCRNHRCIPKMLKCDGFDHCGDNSDEPSTCHQENKGNKGVNPHNVIWWYDNTPNYYFPQKNSIFGSSNGSGILLMSSLFVLLLVIFGLLFILFRQSTRPIRTHRNRDRRNQANFNDGVEIFDASADDPPVYEAPPDYEEVVKLILAGNNLKLVRRPGGLTAWVSNSPKEYQSPPQFRRANLPENEDTRTRSEQSFTADSSRNRSRRTRHASLGSEISNEIVLWQPNSTIIPRKQNNNMEGEAQQSSGYLPARRIDHIRRPSLPITPFRMPCTSNSLQNQSNTLDTEMRNNELSLAEDESLRIISDESVKCSDISRKENIIASSFRKSIKKCKKKSSSRKKYSSKNSNVKDIDSFSHSPPPYEISPSYKITKGKKSHFSFSKYDKLNSPNFKRTSFQRSSTALRVRAARERFQKLSKGEPVKMIDLFDSKGKSSSCCKDKLKNGKSNSVEFICKGTVQEKKAELLKVSIQNCSCSDDCACAILKYNLSDKEKNEYVEPGLVRSKIQYYKTKEVVAGNQLCNHLRKNKPFKGLDNKTSNRNPIYLSDKYYCHRHSMSCALPLITRTCTLPLIAKNETTEFDYIYKARQQLFKINSWPTLDSKFSCHYDEYVAKAYSPHNNDKWNTNFISISYFDWRKKSHPIKIEDFNMSKEFAIINELKEKTDSSIATLITSGKIGHSAGLLWHSDIHDSKYEKSTNTIEKYSNNYIANMDSNITNYYLHENDSKSNLIQLTNPFSSLINKSFSLTRSLNDLSNFESNIQYSSKDKASFPISSGAVPKIYNSSLSKSSKKIKRKRHQPQDSSEMTLPEAPNQN